LPNLPASLSALFERSCRFGFASRIIVVAVAVTRRADLTLERVFSVGVGGVGGVGVGTIQGNVAFPLVQLDAEEIRVVIVEIGAAAPHADRRGVAVRRAISRRRKSAPHAAQSEPKCDE
jgi:hypothetical protein